MQLIQFFAAWLFPGAKCFAVEMATADSSELDDRASWSPSSSVSAAGSGSSLSSPSSTSSSDGHRGFFKSRSRQDSPSTTPLCFGAGGSGAAAAGRRLLRGSRARAPVKQQPQAAATMAPKIKGDVVGRYLRKISRRLRKARSDDGKGSPSPMAAAVDDTARERAESVARAISYCKDTLRRGNSRSRSRSPSPPPPPPSPSLDEWLHDRQEEITATAAVHWDECSSDPRSSPTRPRRAAGWPLGMQTMAKRFKESPCPCSASPSRDSSLAAAACAVAHDEESPQPHHGHGRLSLLASHPRIPCNATLNP